MLSTRHLHSRPSRKSLCWAGTGGLTTSMIRARYPNFDWTGFDGWMSGQTAAYCPGCQQVFYFRDDVERYARGERMIWD